MGFTALGRALTGEDGSDFWSAGAFFWQIGARPSIYIMDTPGVMVPRVADYETGLKLAITGCIKDSVVGEENMALYLLGRLIGFPREMRAAVAAERQSGVEKGGSGPDGGHPAFHRMRRGKGPVATLEKLLPVDDVAPEDLEWWVANRPSNVRSHTPTRDVHEARAN